MAPAAAGLIERWAHLYADSKALSAGILGAGGIAIAADRVSLLLPADAGEHLAREIERLKAVHTWVLAGLTLTIATGVLQLFSDLHTYLASWIFWTKMGLIALLLLNGWVRLRAERGIEAGIVQPHLARFRRTSMASLVLWFAILLAGAFLTTVS